MAKGLFSWLGLGKKNKEKEQNAEGLKNQEQKQGKDLIKDDESLEGKKHIVAAKETYEETAGNLEASIEEKKDNAEAEDAKEAEEAEKALAEDKQDDAEAKGAEEAEAEEADKALAEEKQDDAEAKDAEEAEEAEKALAEDKQDDVEVKGAEEAEEAEKALAEDKQDDVEVKGAEEAEDAEKVSVEEKKDDAEVKGAEEAEAEEKKESVASEDVQENVADLDKKKIDKSKDESAQKVKKSFFERLKKTRDNLAYGLSALIVGKKIDDELYEDLETALLTADLGVETTEFVIEKLKEESKARELHDAIALKANLKKILTDILKPCEIPLHVEKKGDMPFVILMVGVNGAGKTTTIGKLALKFKEQGLKVMLGAGDTFRAAAVEQLKEWGKRTDVPVISQPTGSDSASVLFDALSSAKSKNIDVLICDTAGRLQNKDNLMEELKKIVRVMKKISDDVPHEVLLVLDSTTGQNAVSQMKLFSEAVKVTGLCLTKLDGSAKGGVIFALADKFKTPVRFVGIGEKTEDLRVFDVDNFVDALISDNL